MNKDKRQVISNERRLEIYTDYVNKIDAIKHFEVEQKKVQKIPSLIALGALAINGFLILSAQKVYHENHFILLTAVNLFAAYCINSMWKTDLLFKNDIALINFIDGKNLEKKYDWLPTSFTKMIKKDKHNACPAKKVWFYIMLEGLMILMLGGSLLGLAIQYNMSEKVLLGIIGLTTSSTASITVWMFLKTRRFDRIVKKIEREAE